MKRNECFEEINVEQDYYIFDGTGTSFSSNMIMENNNVRDNSFVRIVGKKEKIVLQSINQFIHPGINTLCGFPRGKIHGITFKKREIVLRGVHSQSETNHFFFNAWKTSESKKEFSAFFFWALRKFGYEASLFASLALFFQWFLWFFPLSNVSLVRTAGALTNPALVEFCKID